MSLTARIDVLNIGLMLTALVVAIQLPFELVLFSYGILGPLHYLTEISWLHDRSYFTEHKHDFVLLIVTAMLIVALTLFWPADALDMDGWKSQLSLVALGGALLFVATRSRTVRWLGFGALGLVMLITHQAGLSGTRDYHAFFLLLLPTVVHICVFTGAFIMFGALKANSRTGYAALCVFVACIAACLLLPSMPQDVSDSTRHHYKLGFESLTNCLGYYLGHDIPSSGDVIFEQSPYPTIARFLAFAYTYHYLNWFSKTKIIRWHEVPAWRYVLVGVVWVASLGLSAYDFYLGFQWLLFLSLVHVFLEFPLNFRSFLGIGRELAKRLPRAAR